MGAVWAWPEHCLLMSPPWWQVWGLLWAQDSDGHPVCGVSDLQVGKVGSRCMRQLTRYLPLSCAELEQLGISGHATVVGGGKLCPSCPGGPSDPDVGGNPLSHALLLLLPLHPPSLPRSPTVLSEAATPPPRRSLISPEFGAPRLSRCLGFFQMAQIHCPKSSQGGWWHHSPAPTPGFFIPGSPIGTD